MATWVVPTPLDADNSAGSFTLAACNDWRTGVRRFHVGTGHDKLTYDAGYTSAGSLGLPPHPIKLLPFGWSQYTWSGPQPQESGVVRWPIETIARVVSESQRRGSQFVRLTCTTGPVNGVVRPPLQNDDSLTSTKSEAGPAPYTYNEARHNPLRRDSVPGRVRRSPLKGAMPRATAPRASAEERVRMPNTRLSTEAGQLQLQLPWDTRCSDAPAPLRLWLENISRNEDHGRCSFVL